MDIKIKKKFLSFGDHCLKDLRFIFKYHKTKNIFKHSTVVLTGADGFIGYLLSKYFIFFNNKLKLNKLILIDINFKKRAKYQKNIYFLKKNLIKEKLDFLKKEKNIIFFHAASIASPMLYRKYPLKTIFSNVDILRNILEFSKQNKRVKKILYFSSSEIYGNPNKKNIPTDENYFGNVNPIGPRACYDETKRFCETLCYNYSNIYKTPVVVIRPFNNYGPGMKQNDQRLPADLYYSVIKNKKIKLFSNGRATRSFCYIADAIVGYLNSLKAKKFEVFNIGSDQSEISVNNFTVKFVQVARKKLNYTHKPFKIKSLDKHYLTDNPQRRMPNITKANNSLDFKPRISLAKGIERFLDYNEEFI